MFFSWLSGLKRQFQTGKAKQRTNRPARRMPFEELEHRTLLTAYLVNIAGDSSGSNMGTGSGTSGDLRYCFNLAASDTNPDTISFDSTVFTSAMLKTIELNSLLTSLPPAFTNAYGQTSFVVGAGDSITIDGSLGAEVSGITIDGGGLTRLFAVVNGGSLVLNNMTLTGGQATGGAGGNDNIGGAGGGGAGLGGAVLMDGLSSSFTANGVTFVNNQALGGAGGSTSSGVIQSGAGGGGLDGDGATPAGSTGGAGGGVNGGAGGTRQNMGDLGGLGGGGGGGGDGFHGTGIGSVGGNGGFGGGGGGGGNYSRGGYGGFGGGGGGGGGGRGSSVGGNGGYGGGHGGSGEASGLGGGGGGGAGLGGAIFSNSGTLTLTNATFTQNSATGGLGGTGASYGDDGVGQGGAVFIRNGTLNATFVTFTSNAATEGGTDLLVLSDGFGQQAIVNVVNSILGQDTGTAVTDFYATTNGAGTLADMSGSTNNLVTLNGTGANGLPAGALVAGTTPDFDVAGLADNGGPTKTFALTAVSTAALQTGATGTGITTDQRGILRSATPDLGAFQFSLGAPTIDTISPNIGPAGTSVTISGTGFQSGATVTFGGVAATNVVVVDDSTITATTPTGTSGAKDVVVTNLDLGTVTEVGGYTYVVAPTDISLSNSSLTENAGANAFVGTFSTTDTDSGDTFTYALVSGMGATNNALFKIVGNKLQANSSFDFEAGSTYSIRVRSTDSSDLTVEKIFTVTITNVNEIPTALMLSNDTIAEDAPINTIVGTFSTTDPDIADTFTYMLVSGTGDDDNAKFTIDSNGRLLTAAAFDYESKSTYSVLVRSTDAGHLFTKQIFTITITNVNEAPTAILLSNNTIAENAPVSTIVGTFSTSDPDADDTFTYTLVPGVGDDDNDSFTIDANGRLLAAEAFDYETRSTYTVRVRSTDSGTFSTEQDFLISILPVNDNAPVFTSPVTFSINENTTAIGTVSATDADLPAQTVTYSITGGVDSALFTINPNTGVLAFLTAPDYENPTDAGADNVYDVEVTANDNAGSTTVQSITVTVLPVNDNAPVFTSPVTFSINENTTAVGTVSATDADLPAQTVTYSITGGADAALFTINPVTGALAFLIAPDYEDPTDAGADNVYNVKVTAYDNAGSTTVQCIAVTVLPVNDSAPVFTSPATFSINENSTAVGTVSATDADLPAQTVTYSITGGADAALFTINPTTGALAFLTAPDYEDPTDDGADNVYDVKVTANDNAGSTTVQCIAVTVLPINNNAPIFTSPVTFSINENSAAVGTVSATDADLPAQTVTYSITGGADAALFTINPATGALAFLTAPDYEDPTDDGADNVYDVEVTANDNAGLTTVQCIAVTVLPVNDNAPVFTSPVAYSINENTTAVGTVSATDDDLPAQTVTYSITGGADAALFTINPATGALAFLTAPDYEDPTDDGADNVYAVEVTANDNAGSTAVQSITVTVLPVNDNAPVFNSPIAFSINENTTVVGTVSATDGDLPAQTVTYSITGGANWALFTINPSTGVLAFLTAPDYEDPTDADVDNVYDIEVTANDNAGSTTVQSISVTVLPVNDNAPVFTSPVAFSINENTTAVGTVSATDADMLAQTVTFSITGGADSALFTINPTTGALAFLTAPDYEHPTDDGADNVYTIEVTANDNAGSTTVQSITVTVLPVNDNAPVFNSPIAFSINENTTAVGTVSATDADLSAQTVSYSITGGADAALFTINPNTGVLAFLTAPDYENPADAGADNVYNIEVTANDNAGSTTVQSIAVTVLPVNDNAPVFNSPIVFSVSENSTAVGTVSATDADLSAQTLTYSITGGADSALFTINPTTGALAFLTAPDYENPTDAGADNVYDVEVTANDNAGSTTVQSIAVTVLPVNDNAPVFNSPIAFSINENATAVGTVSATDTDLPAQSITYSITGGADSALFTINPTTGALAFLTAPDYENPTDAGADNVYDVEVTANDNAGSTTVQSIAVTVLPVNDNAPVFNSPIAFSVNENSTAVGTVSATDADLSAQTVTYSITGGADSELFTINPTTGALAFLTAPDYENPTDAGADNVYNIVVTANDNAGSTTVQSIAVTVLPVNDNAPVFNSPIAFSINENSTAVGTVSATDADLSAQTLTYSITGGADSALFTINPTTGALAFLTAPDYENPTDAGADNVYDIVVTANDNAGSTTVQSITVTVLPVNDNAPVFNSPIAFSISENATAVGTVSATDADLSAQTVTYSITGGADSELFTINPTTGALAFLTAPDYENPTDAGADNVYDVEVTANDNSGSTTVQSIAVTVLPVNDNGPIFTSPLTYTVAENSTVVGTVTAPDADQPGQTITYSITGGADAALFTINPSTGQLSFLVAPDYEHPTDVGANNTYEVQVTADDGSGSTTAQDLTINVTNVVEEPVITLNPNEGTYHVGETTGIIDSSAGYQADVTETDYSSAVLTVSITANRQPKDSLTIDSHGTGPGQISVKGKKIYFGDTLIGTFSGGTKRSSNLVISFNSSASESAVQALVKQISFTTKKQKDSQPTRTIQMQITNVSGHSSSPATRDVAVV